jgi:hypothetical protein
VFAIYVIYRLVNEARALGRPLPTIVVHAADGYAYCFSEHGVRYSGNIFNFEAELLKADT